jgi:hypothetical protein
MRAIDDPRWNDPQHTDALLGGGVTCNGVDASAVHREHVRALNMARQAAEKHYARRGLQPGVDRNAQLTAARERTAELRAELARLDAEHRRWLTEQGERIPDLRARPLRLPGSD